MWNVGDLVVHPRYGPAVIEKITATQKEDQKKSYYCLRLAGDRDKSMVMIPEDAIDTVGLRTKLLDAETIRTIMHEDPDNLEEETLARQKYIKATMQSKNPHELVSLLRDIYWLEKGKRLSQSENKSRNDLLGILGSELSISQDISTLMAQTVLKEIIKVAMDSHPLPEDDLDPTETEVNT
jgi:RNA polymerase-interacting CarD/CdnL/TRCF family regulator